MGREAAIVHLAVMEGWIAGKEGGGLVLTDRAAKGGEGLSGCMYGWMEGWMEGWGKSVQKASRGSANAVAVSQGERGL